MRNKNPSVVNLGNSGAGTVALDCARGSLFTMVLTGNCTIEVANLVPGESVKLALVQDAVGSRVPTFSGYTIAGSVAVAQGTLATTVIELTGTGAATAAVTSSQATSAGGNSLSTLGGYLTLANDAADQPNGISLDAAAGDTVRCRVGGTTRVVMGDLSGAGFASIQGDSGAQLSLVCSTLNINPGLASTIVCASLTLAAGGINVVTAAASACAFGPASQVRCDATGLGFYNTAPIAKPTVTGAKGGNAALTSLVTQLAALGLITDGTS